MKSLSLAFGQWSYLSFRSPLKLNEIFTFKRFSYVKFFFDPFFCAISEKKKCVNKTNATMILHNLMLRHKQVIYQTITLGIYYCLTCVLQCNEEQILISSSWKIQDMTSYYVKYFSYVRNGCAPIHKTRISTHEITKFCNRRYLLLQMAPNDKF